VFRSFRSGFARLLRAGLLTLVFPVLLIQISSASIVFESEFLFTYEESDNAWVIDSAEDSSGDVSLQFGNDITPTENGSITWDVTNDYFDINAQQFANFRLENSASDPVACSPTFDGRMYINTTNDNVYVCDGTSWVDLTVVNTTSTKVITIGTGLDYADIASGATYLNGLSGGIMLLAAETHAITTEVDLTNILLIGKDPTKSTIAMSGAGQINAFDTQFRKLTIDVNTITDDMAIDMQTGASAISFEDVAIDVQDSGDSLLDSNAGTAPTITASFFSSEQSGGSGTIVKAQSPGNLNAASDFFVSGARSNMLLTLDDWDVTIEGAGNVFTTGTITSIPENTIIVYPDMDLQGAINSLPSGGSITLLPGTHNITEPILITQDSLEIQGYGDASIIAAASFTGITNETAAIQVGAADGSAAANNVQLDNFKLTVSSNIHGVRYTGGDDHKVTNLTVQKLAGQSGTGGSANIGILMLDSTGDALVRPEVSSNRVLGNGGTIYFTDGVHVTSDPDYSGVFGYDTGVEAALVESNFVDYVRETGYALAGVTNSSLFNNRATNMGAGGGGAFGIFFSNCSNINMTANVFSGSLSTATDAIAIDPFNAGSLKSTTDSLFTNNIIDGTGDGGVGFEHGFLVGNATNTTISRNSFQNNTILGAAAVTTYGFRLTGDADANNISDNSITGGTNPWDNGIFLASAASEQNIVRDNRFDNVTSLVTDSATATRYDVTHHRAATDPTVNDDSGDGYHVGTMWINTATDDAYVLLDDTVGAAVWTQVDGTSHTQNTDTGTDSDTFTLDNDGTGGDITLQFGSTIAKTLTWDNTNTRFTFDDDLRVEGNAAIIGAAFIADDHAATDSDGTLNLGRNGNAWETLAWDDTGDEFDLSDDLNITGSVTASATQTKYLYLGLNEAIRGSAPTGSVAGGNAPVIRLDGTGFSRARWSVAIPDDYVAGTDIDVEIFWSTAEDGGAGEDFVWDFDYGSFGTGDTLSGGAFTSTTTTVDVSAETSLNLNSTTFTVGNAVISADEMLNVRVSRDGDDAADDFPDEINIHMIRVEYTGKKVL